MMRSELIYAPTDDGWRLALHRWMPESSGVRRRYPILMVHGLAANRLNLDLDERHSVARAACARGYDVFVLELRGAGVSGPLSPASHSYDRGWGFGAHARVDLPTAVRMVLAVTGARQLHGFGHSMGGMLMYAFAVGRPPELRSLCTVASPLVSEFTLGERARRLLELAEKVAARHSSGYVPIRRLVRVASHFMALSSRLADGILINANNTEPDVIERMARDGIDDVPLQLFLELASYITDGSSPGCELSYEQHLDTIDVPVFAISGAVDHVAPPSCVEALVARLTTKHLHYREMGRRLGENADYGHGDLLVGREAAREVYPPVLDFFDEVD